MQSRSTAKVRNPILKTGDREMKTKASGATATMESVHPCPRVLQRRGYEDLTLHKQTAVRQEKIGLP